MVVRYAPELHLVQLELLMDVQLPKLALKPSRKIAGDVYNMNIGVYLTTA